ncbi:hypothetical protein RFI_28230 [Reticulomyxa filosa]|uniref:Uncharacterized protein n=1 Tax=Reticulomyxa filosa TaxID=46433 RepID=X6M6R5_RETFI|nr:hypothetical protein RFI_28230 [Reticulomyxa filosa]|eukprot:ETO09157.1 hypothetical protein RFI_28230 [Reticulomyxa filosa]
MQQQEIFLQQDLLDWSMLSSSENGPECESSQTSELSDDLVNELFVSQSLTKKCKQLHQNFCKNNSISFSDTNGGWTPSDHQTLVLQFFFTNDMTSCKICHRFELLMNQCRELPPRRFFDQLKLYLPHNLKVQILKNQKKEKISKEKVVSAFSRITKQDAIEQENFLKKLQMLHHEMSNIKDIKQSQLEQEEKRKKQQEAEEQKKQRQKQEIWQHDHEIQKQQVKEYHDLLEKRKERILFEKQQALEKALQEKRDLMKLNTAKTQFRSQLWNSKHKLLEEQKKCKLEAFSERMSKKLNLNYSCDNYLRKTFTFQTKADKNNCDLSTTCNLFPNYGYTEDELFEDARYQLQHELYKANLQNSKYAKEVMARFVSFEENKQQLLL